MKDKATIREIADSTAIRINDRLTPQNNQCDRHLPQKKNMRLLKFLEDCEHFDIFLPASKVKQLILQNLDEIVHYNPRYNNPERFEGHKPLKSSQEINNSAEAPGQSSEMPYCQW